ncbi:hypothetical protein SSP24_47560 [Streptomyces spinoverrucosus]|uniref:MalT-like TPR region domain-containing protein n=2 Tax=Streptomyces spinoverrucosus TaxID=284043 RepID=A0A4Y3VMY1_9ACTN|nr:tetratricopeptide repeat protein [Streptomyces spinoverrucosus]GEC07101.1 hypothetical protein SSP24_47560 [Streptomyces spinoverrucosus]GHB81363.1 hypothetical protein GCM10010397_60470 [Streptomyces spinoverrucosus]
MARLVSAHDDFTTGLRIFRETGNRYFEGFGLVGLGMACRDLGRLHEAAVHLERAIGLDAELSRWDNSSAVRILGGVYWELGRLADGLHLLRPAVASAERAGYRDSRAMMLDALAKISLELGRHQEGLEQAERALAMVRDTKRHWIQAGIETRFKRAEADSLLSLSLTHLHLGQHDEARTHAEQALRLAHRPDEARTLMALARIHRKTDGAAAELMRQQAWDIEKPQVRGELGQARLDFKIFRTLPSSRSGPSPGAPCRASAPWSHAPA